VRFKQVRHDELMEAMIGALAIRPASRTCYHLEIV
jgi:hypothetical protein